MNRLKHILLAGALAPALTLTPLMPAGAQDQDQGEHHPKRQHEGEHGKRSEAGAPERKGERGGERSGERRAGGRDEAGAPAKAKRAADDEEAPRGGKHRKARDAGDAAPASEKAQTREDRGQRREADDRDNGRRAKDRDPGDQRPSGQQERRDERKLGKEDRGDQRKLGKEDRRDERQLGKDERRDERKLGNDERRDQRQLGNEDRRDERQLGKEDRRDQRKLGDEERRDQRRLGNEERRDERQLGREERGGPGGPAVGFAGGFLPPSNARSIDQLRRDRREVREGDRTFIREPGRTIVEERGRTFIVHDETDRYRALGYDVRRERRGDQFIDTIRRPNGDVIVTYTDESGRLLRRVRRGPGGREVVLIENGVDGRVRPYADDVVVLPPPPLRIPRDRYVVDYGVAAPALLYETLIAPPLAPPPQRYTLDQIRYSPDVRSYVRQIDINTINFDTGSWEVPHEADGKLEALADAMNKAIDRNPNSVFLVEGYTDATGNPTDNLSLSDRRAQSVAEILTKDFKIPPENLTTQGYGQQNLKVDTQGPSAANRRVVVQNITQLLASGGAPAGQ